MKTKFIKIFNDNIGSWELINSRDVLLIAVKSFKHNKDLSDVIELNSSTACDVDFHDVVIYALNKHDEVIVYKYSTAVDNYALDDEAGSFVTEFEEDTELCKQFLIAKEMDGLGGFYIKKSEITVISGYERMDDKGGLYFCSNIETTLMGAKFESKLNIPKGDADFFEYPIFASQSPEELIDQLESC